MNFSKFFIAVNYMVKGMNIKQGGRGHWTVNYTGTYPKLLDYARLKTLGT